MMVQVSGPLRVVTDRPLLVSQVRVRAARDRAEHGGLTAAFDDSVPVTDGQLVMEVLPGPAVLVLEVTGGFSHAVKLVVPDAETATLEQCVTAADIAGDADKRTLERLAGEVARDVAAVSQAAEQAGQSAAAAGEAEKRAGEEAEAAAASASAAGQSETRAQEHATVAGEAEARALDYATAADGSEQASARHAKAAEASAHDAERSAERVATIAGSTRWIGTQVEVNGQLSPDLKGEQGEPGPPGEGIESATYSAEPNTLMKRTSTGAVSVADPTASVHAANKRYVDSAVADAKPSWDSLSGKPSTFPPEAHKHTLADITNAPNSHTSAQTSSTLMSRDSAGRARVNNPSNNLDIANKSYVDNAASTTLANAKAYTDALIVEGNTSATDGKLHIVYE